MVPPLILADTNETIDAPRLFLSAAQQAFMRNAKMQQLSNQLSQMNQRAQTAETRLEFEDKWNTAKSEAARDRIGVADDRLKLDQEKADFQKEKWGKDSDALSGYQKELFNIDASPGTQQWEHQANLIRSKPEYSEVARSQQGEKLWADAFNSHKQTAREITQSGVQIAKDYYQNIGKKRIPEDWLTDGKDWDKNETGDRFVAYDPETGQRLPKNTKTTPSGKPVTFRTISTKEYDTILEQQKRLRELGSSDSTLPADVPPPQPKVTTVKRYNPQSGKIETVPVTTP